MGLGLKVWFLGIGLLFVGLAGRMLYLGSGNEEQVATAHGVEVEVLRVYPPLLEAGAAAGQPRQVRVPGLTGKTFAQAGAALGGTGLVLEGLGDVHGKVVRQEPAPGRALAPGAAVRVWLAR
ncbi:MAG: hypothetical protein K0R39_1654 [Symbiobacteriaceae bacterium]|nr:hypothetical protein [Symbiobacteriaceae bacterium]